MTRKVPDIGIWIAMSLVLFVEGGHTHGQDLKNYARTGFFPDLETLSRPVDVSKSDEVVLELARLSSGAYYVPRGQLAYPLPQRVFMPFRSNQLATPQARFPQGAAATMNRFDQLMKCDDAALRKAAESLKELTLFRCQVAQANELFGNTATSSIQNMQARLRQYIGGQNFRPDLTDRAHREREQKAAAEAADLVLQFLQEAEVRSLFGGVIRYAAFDAAEDAGMVWKKLLWSRLEASAGPKADASFATMGVHWRDVELPGQRARIFQNLGLTNSGATDLNNVAIEIEIENEFKDRAISHYFVPELKSGGVVLLHINPFWDNRRGPFSNQLKVTFAVISSARSQSAETLIFKNPRPRNDTHEARESFLKFDSEYSKAGIGLGNLVQKFLPRP